MGTIANGDPIALLMKSLNFFIKRIIIVPNLLHFHTFQSSKNIVRKPVRKPSNVGVHSLYVQTTASQDLSKYLSFIVYFSQYLTKYLSFVVFLILRMF